MELHQLQAFVTVARELNFSRAAQLLHIAQPALSRKLQHLEADLDVSLIDRSSHPIALTEPGKRFLLDAQRILLLCSRSIETARRLNKRGQTSLRIGYATLLHHRMMISALQTYLYTHADIAITILEMSAAEQLAAIDQKLLDIGFVFTRRAQYESDTLATETIADHAMVVALPADSLLASRQVIPAAELSKLLSTEVSPISLVDSMHPTSSIAHPLGVRGLTMELASDDPQAVIRCVEAGLGLAILPEEAMQLPHDGLVFRPVTPAVYWNSLLVWRRADTQDAVREFVSCVQHTASDIRQPQQRPKYRDGRYRKRGGAQVAASLSTLPETN